MRSTGPCSNDLTDSVDVRLDVWRKPSLGSHVGYVVAHDHVDLLNVNTSSDDVGSDEDFRLAFSEAVEDLVSVCG